MWDCAFVTLLTIKYFQLLIQFQSRKKKCLINSTQVSINLKSRVKVLMLRIVNRFHSHSDCVKNVRIAKPWTIYLLFKNQWGDMLKKSWLGLQEGGSVGHEGRGVLEVDPVGQVPLLLLLLHPPVQDNQIQRKERAGGTNCQKSMGFNIYRYFPPVQFILTNVQLFSPSVKEPVLWTLSPTFWGLTKNNPP